MTRKAAPAPVQVPPTLSDVDITSRPAVTRRSLLGVLGVGAGMAAAMAFGTAESVPAADSDTSSDRATPPKKTKTPPKEADSD